MTETPDPTTYLDYNATTPVLPEVAEAVSAALLSFGNPSSVHAPGRKARAAVEDARGRVAALVNARAQDVVFTSGGTEANALALRGLAASGVVASAAEHASVLAHVTEENRVAVETSGVVDLAALERALMQRTAPVLVTVMLANNETGVLQPVTDVVKIARKHGAFVHCDAVQGPGKIAIDMQALGVDSLSLSAHKFGGVKGVGALVLRPGLDLTADLPGGGQERRRRAGTENVPGIVGFGVASRAEAKLRADADRVTKLRDGLEGAVVATTRARVIARGQARLANTSCILLPGVSSETQLMRLDLAGVAVSAGSACSSGKIAPSHVLLAMGVPPADAKSAIRVSLGWNSTEADIARFLETWQVLAASAAA